MAPKDQIAWADAGFAEPGVRRAPGLQSTGLTEHPVYRAPGLQSTETGDAPQEAGMDAEIVIRGGTVVDGSGSPGRRADVAVDRGRIVEVGTGLTGSRELDASGLVVSPGFIDIHTHYDAQVFWDPWLTPSAFHGVTTVVA